MKKNIILTAIIVVSAAALISCKKNEVQVNKEMLPAPGTKIVIDKDYSFSYQFSQKPSLGMVVVKIQILDKNGKQVTPFKITGESGMPSMRGAHDSGVVEFKTNAKGDYLLPVNIVMPGDWEVRILIKKGESGVFKGTINFDV